MFAVRRLLQPVEAFCRIVCIRIIREVQLPQGKCPPTAGRKALRCEARSAAPERCRICRHPDLRVDSLPAGPARLWSIRGCCFSAALEKAHPLAAGSVEQRYRAGSASERSEYPALFWVTGAFPPAGGGKMPLCLPW